MANKNFTDEEKTILNSNKYTYNATNRTIKFTSEFKRLFFDKIESGISPVKAIKELGYDTKILGEKRIYGIALHIREEHELYGEFSDQKRDSSLETKIKNNEIAPSKALLQMQTKIAYLEQEIEFLKKILGAEK